MTHRKVTICENCRTTLQGDYCHECGQRGVELRRPVLGLAQDIIIETLSIDGRLWRTIKGLFFNPGRVATDYVDGHRARFTPPFRIFLFFSLVYFFTLFTIVESGGQNVTTVGVPVVTVTDDGETEEALPAEPEIPAPVEVPAIEPEPAEETTEDEDVTVGLSATIDDKGNFNYSGPEFLRPFAERIAVNIELAQEDPRLFLAQVRELMPRVLLVMPAAYMLLLFVFYFYKKPYMYDLLIISLYMHAALYFYLFLALVFQVVPDVFYLGDIAAFAVQVFGMVQSYRVLRTAFRSGWISTILKGTLINAAFWTVAMIVMLLGLVLSLY